MKHKLRLQNLVLLLLIVTMMTPTVVSAANVGVNKNQNATGSKTTPTPSAIQNKGLSQEYLNKYQNGYDHTKSCVIDKTKSPNIYGVAVDLVIDDASSNKSSTVYEISVKSGNLKLEGADIVKYSVNSDNIVEPTSVEVLGDARGYITNYDELVKTKFDAYGSKKTVSKKMVVSNSIGSQGSNDGKTRGVRLRFVWASTDDYCVGADDYRIIDSFSKNDATLGYYKNRAATAVYNEYFQTEEGAIPQQSNPVKYDNKMYNNSACQSIRDLQYRENSVIKQDEFNKYKSRNNSSVTSYSKLAPFCFDQGQVIANYKEERTWRLVAAAMKAVYYTAPVETSDNEHKNAMANKIAEIKAMAEQQQKNENRQHVFDNYHGATIDLTGDKNKLYCNYKFTSDANSLKTFITEEDAKGNKKTTYNYENKSYYFARKIDEVTSVKTSSAELGGYSTNVKICEKVCEEGALVEFGVPQTVNAGTCIEYQFKVSSYVRCFSQAYGNIPDINEFSKYCTPRPNCVHSGALGTRTQAGPNDEFDACINSCDGGKYTQSCSNKCYNKVYGSKTTTKKTMATLTPETKKLSAPGQWICDGYEGNKHEYSRDGVHYSYGYYTNNNGTIQWNKCDGGSQNYARWYFDYLGEDQFLFYDRYNYQSDGNGMKRQNMGQKGECKGTCEHLSSSCSGLSNYLNPETPMEDYLENVERYASDVSKCTAQAICTTTTTNYTINVDYSTKDSKGNVTNHTYKPKTDEKLISGTETNNSIEDKRMIKDFGGCYKKTDKDYYMTEWTFGGTYKNIKTGEISYDKTEDAIWVKENKKFCLPFTAITVNKQWYDYYFTHKRSQTDAGNDNIESVGNQSSGSYVDDKCVTSRKEAPANKDIKWNIHGTADGTNENGFGLFHWKFNINCFFAAKGNDAKETDISEVKKCTTTTTLDNSSVRPYTSENMFPLSGTDLANGATQNKGLTSKDTEREAGYNWTKAATIPVEKNASYAINPAKLIARIQDDSYATALYSDSNYLDYSFTITKTDIQTIRAYNQKTKGYTDWLGTVTPAGDGNKVYVYRSPLFRDTGANEQSTKVLPDSSIKALGTVGVNNQASGGTKEGINAQPDKSLQDSKK